jgi:hypothetical protein
MWGILRRVALVSRKRSVESINVFLTAHRLLQFGFLLHFLKPHAPADAGMFLRDDL